MTNIEIKARAADWDAQQARARALADREEKLRQEDTFFECSRGRLKLRDLGQDAQSYMIFYRRPDTAGPKQSSFEMSSVADAAGMRRLLAQALGQGKVVRKERTLFLCGQTRIHFDEVESMGRFIEIEVCLRPDQSPEQGRAIAEGFIKELGIRRQDLLEGAYADLLP
ncbi:MAG: class IV adenylate cyclase [Elusimicrobiota bacterium]|jgi:adenylate cyclase class IV